MTNSLTEEIVLIAYHDDGIARAGGLLDYSIGGAVLLDLELAGRIEVRDEKVHVTDPAPLGDEVLDAALRQIAEDGKGRKPEDWVYRLGRKVRPRVLDALVRGGVLQRRADRFLLVPYTRFPAPGGVEPPAETALRRRLSAAVTNTGPVEPRTAAMCALIGALGWRRQVFADLPKDEVKPRLTAFRQDFWAAEATHRAVEEMTMTVVVAAT